MDASEPTVADVAAAILDGTSVDWRKVQSIANETEHQLLEQLRVLATLADFHRDHSGDDHSVRRPQTWGHINVLEPIGSGAFGDVYRAWDTRLDREVALKLLRQREHQATDQPRRSIQEGRLLARI